MNTDKNAFFYTTDATGHDIKGRQDAYSTRIFGEVYYTIASALLHSDTRVILAQFFVPKHYRQTSQTPGTNKTLPQEAAKNHYCC